MEELGVVIVQMKLYVVPVHQIDDILCVRSKAEWAKTEPWGTLQSTEKLSVCCPHEYRPESDRLGKT